MKKKNLILCIVTILLVVAALFSAIFFTSKKSGGVLNIKKEKASDFIACSENAFPSGIFDEEDSFLVSYLNGTEFPKIDTDITIYGDSDGLYEDYLNGSTYTIKIKNDESLLINFKAEKDGQVYEDGIYKEDGDKVYSYFPMTCGDQYKMADKERFDIFYNGYKELSNGDTSITELSADEYLERAKENEASSANENSGESLEGSSLEQTSDAGTNTCIIDIVKIGFGVVTDDNITVSKNVLNSFTKYDDSFTGDVYTCTPVASDFENVINNVADYIEQNPASKETIENLFYSLGFFGIDFGDLSSVSFDADSLRTNAKSYAENLASYNFTWSVAINDDNSKEIVDISLNKDENTLGLHVEKNGSLGNITLQLSECNIDIKLNKEGDKMTVLGAPYGEYSVTISDGNGSDIYFGAVIENDGEKDIHKLSTSGSLFDTTNLTIESTSSSSCRDFSDVEKLKGVEPIDYTTKTNKEVSTYAFTIKWIKSSVWSAMMGY